ncbi:MAG: 3-deoxy-7-phosphoheptulonate synthase [Candidatus Cloacimonetes bacterium]|nr:3-deoxy-7-phosphoheptulonate synthase [Candidatus Cloacimonadota bacterium]MCF7814316.1 3-deoxy-7-phosphoheptulonate synthase [Candidatus Cloacimonadota bacterium]MCF7868393.1 3-deoxy-7-phosphoheptulonate synthase [Candidatus Cloacimonadota bacterium]MCF7883842.1 3-deoxy-7-phosphoheptulonate synthase [Candidatus Cloacimonadota bacterium]
MIELKHQKGKSKTIRIKDQVIGTDNFTFIAGPCTIENFEDLLQITQQLKKMGINFFRGGAYKMRTSPYNFQGLGKEGLEHIKSVSQKTGLISVSEIVSCEDVEMMSSYVDILQIGTRNMHNYRLLRRLGSIENPVILKRGMSSTIEEWLLAAEHILEAGNPNVILCERGIRTFENFTRHTLDISAIPAVKSLSNLPIIVDPSHSSGRREMIKSLSWAAMAAGADGLLIETHFNPDSTICDSKQTIDFEILNEILAKKEQLLDLWGKS